MRTEQIPTGWDEHRDGQFFRIAARIFPCELVDGASSLLGTYDDETASPSAVPSGRASSSMTRVGTNPVPVPVRRGAAT